MHGETQTARAISVNRRGFALVTTLLLITLLIAVSAQLATQSCVESASAARRHRTLLHELALDSAVLRIGERLAVPDPEALGWIRALDQAGSASIDWKAGDVGVCCTLGDDAAKFNPVLFQRPDQASLLTRKLNLLAERKSLNGASVSLRPLLGAPNSGRGENLYRWFDQLLTEVEPDALFRWSKMGSDASTPVWSDLVTCWGDGRVDLQRVDVDVLEAVLEDIRPGLARTMLKARPSDRSVNFLQTAMIDVPAEVRPTVMNRIGFDVRRYSLRVQTAVEADRREWYVVLQMDGRTSRVLHRSQLTW